MSEQAFQEISARNFFHCCFGRSLTFKTAQAWHQEAPTTPPITKHSFLKGHDFLTFLTISKSVVLWIFERLQSQRGKAEDFENVHYIAENIRRCHGCSWCRFACTCMCGDMSLLRSLHHNTYLFREDIGDKAHSVRLAWSMSLYHSHCLWKVKAASSEMGYIYWSHSRSSCSHAHCVRTWKSLAQCIHNAKWCANDMICTNKSRRICKFLRINWQKSQT